MGRRPEPAAVKAAKAPVRSTRKRAAAEVVEVPEGGKRTPAGLKGRSAEIWEKIAPKLRDLHLLAQADEHVIARYCRNYAKWEQLRDGLDKRGYTYLATTTNGGKLRRVDPGFSVADRLERQLLAIEDRFGMNPAERQRIMTQRAAPSQGNLPFERRPDDAAAEPAEAAAPVETPVGMLN